MTKLIKHKKLSIITTLGPATSTREIIRDLLPLSSQFRLNSSHLSPEELEEWLLRISNVFLDSGVTIPVVIDLQGAKMRIGRIKAVSKLPSNITLAYGNHSDDGAIIPVPHRRFFEHVQKGERLLLNDGKVTIEITDRISEDNEISLRARILSNGPLSSRKGINRKNHPVPFNSVSDKDKEIVTILNKYDFTSIAISFVVDGSEIDLVRKLSAKSIAAKIERPESFAHLDLIANKSDEVWLCRGDLGAQAGLWEMARLQNQFEKFINTSTNDKSTSGSSTYFYLAGQVFEHMTLATEPTRSEVTHFYNSSFLDYKGIVLSDETAVGENPVNTVKFVRTLQSEDNLTNKTTLQSEATPENKTQKDED